MQGEPQVEDGYTRLSNELLDAMCRAGFSARQWAIVMAVVRKTYGYGKKADDIGLGQLAQMTRIDKAHVSRTVRELADARVLMRREGTFAHSIALNKRYGQWKFVTRKGVLNQQLGLLNEQLLDGVAETATGVAELATPVMIAESATVAEGATVAESATRGLPKGQPQKNTIKRKKNIPPSPQGGRTEDPAGFADAWAIYPKRHGGNSRAGAVRAWMARINAGIDSQEMIDGVRRYAEFCREEGKIGTPYVKTAAAFFGPDLHFREPWTTKRQQQAGSVGDAWWLPAGFRDLVEAANAGCTPGNAWMWEAGKRVRTEQDWASYRASAGGAK